LRGHDPASEDDKTLDGDKNIHGQPDDGVTERRGVDLGSARNLK